MIRPIKLTLWISILCFLGCKHEKDEKVSPILMEKLELIINKYEAHCEENSNIITNPPVYKVDFREIEGDCFVFIGTNVFYEPDMGGCLLYNDNLIAFHNLDNQCNNFVNFDPFAECQELSRFEEAYRGMGSYRSVNWIYKVIDDSLSIYDQKAFPIE